MTNGFPLNYGPLEVVFSFDTTYSMYPCLKQVRGRLQDMIQRLQSDIPGIRMAVFAHGDYCKESVYVTKWIDFTTDVAELCKFVQTVERTRGGDVKECYELVLHQTRTKLSWTPGSRRALVLIGDDEPHSATYPLNKDKIDWNQETRELAMMGVSIYGVQCRNKSRADDFYRTISMSTGGKHLQLENFDNLFHVLMAVCYREGKDSAMLAFYEKEVRDGCSGTGIARDIDAVFVNLREGIGDAPAPLVTPLHSISSSTGKTAGSNTDSGIRSLKTPVKTALTKLPTTRKVLKTFRSKHFQRRRASGLSLFKEENIPRLKRENVPEKNFVFNTLKWSSWILVLSPERPETHEEMWVKRRGLVGYRLNIVKPAGRKSNNQRKVLFEVSVKTPCSGKQRHVVYSSFSSRFLNNASWERCLIGVRGQLERVLHDGCHVYLRYCVVGKRTDPSSLRYGLKRYDYAWKKSRLVRDQPRAVTKGSYCISMDAC